MADQILSVEDSTLQAVADAIRAKAGTTAKLTFPDGFQSALQGIDAYAPAKKIAAVTKTLTPASTSYSIPAGVHTGNGKVRIRTRNTGLKVNGVATDSNTITPSSVEQVVLPTSNYFLQTIYVNAMDASGYFQVATGTKTFAAQTNDFIVDGLSFTPVGWIIILQEYGSSESVRKLAAASSVTAKKYNTVRSNYSWGETNDTQGTITKVETTMKSGKVEFIRGTHFVNAYFYGTYFYMIWGN